MNLPALLALKLHAWATPWGILGTQTIRAPQMEPPSGA